MLHTCVIFVYCTFDRPNLYRKQSFTIHANNDLYYAIVIKRRTGIRTVNFLLTTLHTVHIDGDSFQTTLLACEQKPAQIPKDNLI